MAGRIAYLGNISAQGLVLDLDAAIQGSYPKTGSLWTDISGNNNNGTLVNGPAYTGSDYGAIVFDGTDDYVNINNFISNPNTLTISTVHKPSSTVSAGVIVGYRSGTTELLQLTQQTPTSSFFQIRGSGNTLLNISQSNALNTATFLTAIFNKTTGIHTLYQNASPVSSILDLTGQTLNSTALNIGITNNGSLIAPYSGSIYNTQIYNQALTQFQVWQNFNAYKSRYGIPDIVTDGLILNLDAGNPYSYLSGSSGTTWTNTVAVSSSISGTLVNGTTYSNGAMVFDGTNDYVSIPAHPTSSGLTLSFWAYIPSTLGTLPTLIGDGSQSNTVGYIWIYRSNINQVTWQFATDTARNLINVPTIFSGSLNSWANYVFVADYTNYPTGSLTVYKNGVLSTTTTFPNIQIPLSRTRFIGSYDGSLYQLSGSISSYLEYDKALTQSEITQNFNALRGRYGI